MSARTVVVGLAAILMLSRVELPGQRRSAEPPIRQIDHVMIKADDPHEVFAFFTETLGLPVAWPVEERGGVVSGGVGFGNVNVEAIRFPGQRSLPSRGQLTGFGFEPSSMRTCLDELQRRGVPYGPLRPLIVTDSEGAKRTLFTNVTLLGLSDTALSVDATMHIFLRACIKTPNGAEPLPLGVFRLSAASHAAATAARRRADRLSRSHPFSRRRQEAPNAA